MKREKVAQSSLTDKSKEGEGSKRGGKRGNGGRRSPGESKKAYLERRGERMEFIHNNDQTISYIKKRCGFICSTSQK